jgi:EAL domain-containing protein (putative c-di-GMP-specific phosphodiesterase class I)
MGIAICPDDGLDMHTLMKNADTALFRAKDAGRNTYQFYEADMNADAFERLRLEGKMHRALEKQELRLHYQPQVDLVTGRPVCLEALVRWEDPGEGTIPPEKFIPIAEENGLILQYGEWVLRTACRQCRAWFDAGYNLRVAVNVSSVQFRQMGFAKTVSSVLSDTGLPAGLLELEITEGVIMRDIEASSHNLAEMNKLGVRIAIDDFGIGYSSLSYLKRFPIHVLKIDRSFVQNILTDPDDAAIAGAVASMAHSLNLEVVAEGVETAGQLEFIRSLKCHLAQGYLFSRPLDATSITDYLGYKMAA